MLYMLENILSLVFLNIINLFLQYNLKSGLDITILYNFWRLVTYGIPFTLLLMLFLLFLKKINKFNIIFISFFNVFIFALLTILTRMLYGNNIPIKPEGFMFWVSLLSIFITPILVFKLPIINKNFYNIMNYK